MKTYRLRKWGTAPSTFAPSMIRKTRSLSEYLDNSVPMQSDKLKVRLIKEGMLDEKCYNCGREEWENEEIPLQLSHKNGDPEDNSLKNLELLCPNCHAQTDNWRMKNEHQGSDINEAKTDRNTDV
tara:strand:+ start:114 stop:488 length:375 start_codon:yes stop_codon:yes gene_type:complete